MKVWGVEQLEKKREKKEKAIKWNLLKTNGMFIPS